MALIEPATAEPLFIVGCVRSGTTLVRDLLRRQPEVICPEETHYFRYGEPFRTNGNKRPLMGSPTLQKHREIDGISQDAFKNLYEKSRTRSELLCRHIEIMAESKGFKSFRWFDKTPQNVYGIHLIKSEFPKARFLHLVRNPLNVVASLKLGKIVKVEDIHGACNYWIEAVGIINQMRPILGNSLLELRYEDLSADPVSHMSQLLDFSGLGNRTDLYSADDVHAERDQYREILTEREKEVVASRCRVFALQYGYKL